jgi:hypothetical protein
MEQLVSRLRGNDDDESQYSFSVRFQTETG